MKDVRIKLSDTASKAFTTAPKAEQERMEKIISEVIEYIGRERGARAFFKARAELSQEAIANGLTPEILESLLQDES